MQCSEIRISHLSFLIFHFKQYIVVGPISKVPA